MNFTKFFRKIVQREPLIIIKQKKTHWDSQFKLGKWNTSEESGQNVGIIARIIIRESQKRPIRILDVGCGSAVLGQYIAHISNITYVGYDISKEALKIAAERVPEAEFHQVDVNTEYPYTQERFDIIVFAEMLYYCEYKKIINSYQTLLVERGFIIISLYQTWRTRFIWSHLKKIVSVTEDVYIKDTFRKVAWRVRTCIYINTIKK